MEPTSNWIPHTGPPSIKHPFGSLRNSPGSFPDSTYNPRPINPKPNHPSPKLLPSLSPYPPHREHQQPAVGVIGQFPRQAQANLSSRCDAPIGLSYRPRQFPILRPSAKPNVKLSGSSPLINYRMHLLSLREEPEETSPKKQNLGTSEKAPKPEYRPNNNDVAPSENAPDKKAQFSNLYAKPSVGWLTGDTDGDPPEEKTKAPCSEINNGQNHLSNLYSVVDLEAIWL